MATFKQYQKKNGDSAWLVKGYLGVDPATGKQVNIQKRGFPTKKEAQLYLNRKLVEIESNGFRKKRMDTFQDVYELWLETYELTVKESSFVKLTQKFKNYILPALGEQRISKITVADVQKFANYMCLEKQNSQYKEYISNVSRIFDFAMKQGLVTDNPAKRIVMPRMKQSLSEEAKINFFTKDQLKTLLSDAKLNEPMKIYTLVYVLANTGCRQGEVLGLEWNAINFTKKTQTIRQTLTRGKNRRLYLEAPKTKKSKRTIPLDEATISLLKAWRKSQRQDLLQLGFNALEPNQLVFSNENNEFIELSHPRLWLHRICKRAGVPQLNPHALRHTFATLLISQDVNPKTVSELLGHTTVAMTLDTYAGVYDADRTQAIDVLTNILN